MLNKEDYMKIFHEIKNSIAIINSYLQLVEKKHPEVADFDYWPDTNDEVTRLKDIVTKLSQVKLGNGLQLEALDICSFLAKQCASFRCMKEEAGINIKVNNACQPLYIYADSNQLHHAFQNLLKNSCEAMNKKGTITIDTCSEQGMALITLTDYGGGFKTGFTCHAFEPFASTKENGSGLGLVITRQIIEAHNGSIAFESRPGDGCTFFVRLPLFS